MKECQISVHIIWSHPLKPLNVKSKIKRWEAHKHLLFAWMGKLHIWMWKFLRWQIYFFILICNVVSPDYKLLNLINMYILIIFIELLQQWKQMISIKLKWKLTWRKYRHKILSSLKVNKIRNIFRLIRSKIRITTKSHLFKKN